MPPRIRALKKLKKKEKSNCENTKKPTTSFSSFDPKFFYKCYSIFILAALEETVLNLRIFDEIENECLQMLESICMITLTT